ncbi:MAG: hypothetical protein NUV51_05710 [Sulfuricaulis sp.]|nr:hypothetical protein [Sulfuricaulis sp.]
MPIDARIALGVQPMQIDSPMRVAGQGLQLQNMLRQGDMQAMQMQDMQAGRERQNALRALLAQDGDMATLPDRLIKGGFVDEGLKYRKSNAEGTKLGAETQKAQLEAGAMAAKQFADTMAGVRDQQSYQAAMSSLASNPAFAPMLQQLPQQWTPEFGQQAVRQAMIAHGKIAETIAKNSSRDIGGAIQTVRTDPLTGAEQIIGAVGKTATPEGLMADARGRQANAISAGNLAVSRDRLNFEKTRPDPLTPIDTPSGIVGFNPRTNTYVPASQAGVPGQAGGQPGQIETAAQLKARVDGEERKRTNDAAIATAADSLSVLDKAITHPGRETASGMSGLVDPRNYTPGTDAKNFRVVLDQIKGKAFLQAFANLKGGGQITEVEGRKATEAIARLDTAQSDGEFKQALSDLREVMAAGYKRLSGQDYSAPSGGSNIDALIQKYGG